MEESDEDGESLHSVIFGIWVLETPETAWHRIGNPHCGPGLVALQIVKCGSGYLYALRL